ncbi:MAG: RsmE family RNA methyltransferase [Proteobacteria bacterium]|nr:RsmE family RNA methyltransferase [Pseudomonadota bacterium]
MTRIFVDPAQLAAGELIVTGDEHHYLSRVRRARGGEIVELVDGAGRRARAEIARIADHATILRVEAPEAIPSVPPVIRAAIPIIKGDRMDTCIEKLVEVGVDAILVWPATRAVVKLDDHKRGTRLAHYQATAQAAARQSGRASVPAVSWTTLAQLLPMRGLVLDPSSDRPVDRELERLEGAQDVTIASGPEGGFAPDELAQLLATWTSIGLGPRVMRADTAPVVAVALIRALTKT